MIPDHKITSTPVASEYFYDKPNTKLIDRTLGGIAIQDISEGLNYQVWEIYYESPFIKIKGLTTGNVIILEEVQGVVELSLAFDLNMNIAYTYVTGDKSYLRYYDATTQNLQTMELIHCKSPRLTYDDLRSMQNQVSDIVCAYINVSNNTLCYRLLRDRYTIEHPLQEVPENARLIRIGMTEGLRLQFKMQLI